MRMPNLDPLLKMLPAHMASGKVPDKKTLETLFKYELAILNLRNEIQDFHDRMQYDRDNSRSRYARLKSLGLVALLLESRGYVKRLVDFNQVVDYEHFDCQRKSGVSKEDLGDVSFEKSCKIFTAHISSFLLTLEGEDIGTLKKRLDQYMAELKNLK